MNQSEPNLPAPRASLFQCEECDPTIELKDSHAAFLHFTECHLVESREDQESPSPPQDVRETEESPPPTEDVPVRCEECGGSFPDSLTFHIHSLLHQDLVLFLCPVPRCNQLFGAPSKVKQHYLQHHGTLLATENQLVLNGKARVILTR